MGRRCCKHPGPGNPDGTEVTMNTVQSPLPRVNPARAEFRPLKAPPSGTYRLREGGRLEVTLTKHGRATTYHVLPLSTDLGGAAFRWHKLDGSGDVYDLLLNGSDTSCSCAGWAFTDSCKHLHCTKKLLDLGVLQVAPGSNAGDDGNEAA
jgi:hypothetical protein